MEQLNLYGRKLEGELGKRQLFDVMITTCSLEDVMGSGKKRKQVESVIESSDQKLLEVVLEDQHHPQQ